MNNINPNEVKNNTKNRKIYEQKFTALKEKIEERRKKVSFLDSQGFSNEEIAKQLEVSLSTIEKDLHDMKYYYLKWSQEMLELDYMKPYLEAKAQLDFIQKEFWIMYRKEENEVVKRQILNSITSLATKKMNIKSNSHFTEHAENVMRRLKKKTMEDLKESEEIPMV